MDGVELTTLKIISPPSGDVLHGIKSTESSFSGFGEAYFSTVNQGQIKGWKKHSKMVLNLIVPVGGIRFVIFDDRKGSQTQGEFMSVTLSLKNYQRLTLSPGLWLGFQGISSNNMLLNIASIQHNPDEASNMPLNFLNFNWDLECK
jgi:dTDP-4-dehydrorhamnose 3,5-epimerase